jgi:hypothetical protein
MMIKPDVDPLKCQVPGCNARWTVSAGWKKCSDHAWTESENLPPFTKPSFFDKPPVKPFTEIDDDEPY